MKLHDNLKNIKCECGYCNHEYAIKIYGTCLLCGKVLDKKAKYKYEMNKRLRLWRKKNEKGSVHFINNSVGFNNSRNYITTNQE